MNPPVVPDNPSGDPVKIRENTELRISNESGSRAVIIITKNGAAYDLFDLENTSEYSGFLSGAVGDVFVILFDDGSENDIMPSKEYVVSNESGSLSSVEIVVS